MAELLNRARMVTRTTGTGTVTLGPGITGYATFEEAGASDGTTYSYLIEEGDDWEYGTGTYSSGAVTLTRNVTKSKINGTAGTSPMSLLGSAIVSSTVRAEDLQGFEDTAEGYANDAAASAASAAAVTGALPRVNRTTLKALDTGSITIAYLTEEGREGFFHWTSGNYSTQITADTAEGIYIKANAVASSSGAWVRAIDGPVNVRWFGAEADGTTNDAPAVQSAINSVVTLGGSLYFPRGVYLFSSQVEIDRTYAVSGSNFVGERNLVISGYGAEIRTTGAIGAFLIKGGWAPNKHCSLEGFTIYHRANSSATFGIKLKNVGICTVKDVTVVVSDDLPADYAAVILENGTDSNPDTGCFWCTVDGLTVRPWGGSEGNCAYGIRAYGAANALRVTRCRLSGSDTHIWVGPHSGQTYTPNAVVIDGNFFEGPSSATAIVLNGGGPAYHVSGCRIINNRFETLDTAVEINGTGTTVQLPTYLAGNYADVSVATYLVNSGNIPVISLDGCIVGSDYPPITINNVKGVKVQPSNSSYDAYEAVAPGLGRGYALRDTSGNLLSSWRSGLVNGSGASIFGGTITPYRPMAFRAVVGLSASDTLAQNLTGQVAFSASTTATVTFPFAEPNANYRIFLDCPANLTFWVTSKSTSGFTLNSSSSTSVTVGWLLVRFN